MEKLDKVMEKVKLLRAGDKVFPLKDHATVSPVQAAPTVAISKEQLERNRVVAHRTRSPEADVFRILRTQVLQAMTKSGFRSLAITSPNYGDGKTTVSLNLALGIALDLKQTVLLADLDLRKPNVHSYLGVRPKYGLTDYLSNNVPVADCLMRLPFDRISILPSGAPLENSSEMLASPRMAALAHEFKTRYPDRLVIYDMPPMLAQDDPLAFLPNVDCVLLVVQNGVSRTQDVERCLEVLADAQVIGTVLNNGA
ncbi:MAG: CpsD/CapB family tyrosine-protein kinase [Candidatus Sungbacteria bacterium]|uniref:non-specific protein-tyrosine kinase n=1 Tax=Candidatus Sungiibacteriota bacterium TaxID=2750080 RepID=A0A932VRU1_9BACT|nr:CpsD/CapB family tyrosine-protein kinase [Candidatus Sungbacteria bacterium]